MDDIIEKRPSSPITTSLLVIAAVCMLAACALMCIELVELKGDQESIEAQRKAYVGKMNSDKDIRALRAHISDVELDEDGGSGDDDPDDDPDDDTDPDDSDG